MHPAFSVIVFTTLSGAGFGMLAWIGLQAVLGRLPGPGALVATLVVAGMLVAIGLCSSVLHLGQPGRAWRAFSQWRTSWLSREAVVALLTFVPLLALLAMALRVRFPGAFGWIPVPPQGSAALAGALLVLLALGSVVCTAMIYHSLKPVPAWRHPLVVPLYLLFSLFTGGLLLGALSGWLGAPVTNMAAFGAVGTAVLLWRLKRHAWRRIDERPLPVTRNAALGLPEGRGVHVFERPHTEANYLLREMGYVLARKHARRLRTLAVLLFGLVPALACLPVWILPHADANPFFAIAALAALAGAFVERWLFFAEAKHLVTLYY